MKTPIGIIGLGIIGSRVAANLRQKGHPVFVWSRSPKNIPNFLGSAAEVAARCPILQFFVSDDAALLEAVQSVVPVLTKKHTLLFHPTVSPETIKRAAGMVASVGARFLEAPFTGSKVAAEKGQLVYYAAGEPALIREMEPLLLDSGKIVVVIGTPGQAAVMKIAANMMIAGTLQIVKEAMALTGAAGIAPERFRAALQSNALNSALLEMKLPTILASDFEPHFTVRHLAKDLRHGADLAHKLAVAIPACDVARASVLDALENGKADLDFSVMAALPGKKDAVSA